MGLFSKDQEPDPQLLLPEDLRGKWAVLPRAELYQLFLSGFIIGAGVLASIAGLAWGPRFLWYGFPIALVLCRLQALVFERKSDRLVDELVERHGDGDAS